MDLASAGVMPADCWGVGRLRELKTLAVRKRDQRSAHPLRRGSRDESGKRRRGGESETRAAGVTQPVCLAKTGEPWRQLWEK